MRFSGCVLLLYFAVSLAVGQTAPSSENASLSNQPEAVVRSFYELVVARHPKGIPADAEMKVFAPYLSKALLHKFDLAKACSADWDRYNPEPGVKASAFTNIDPFSSGNGWGSEPQSFQIERTRSEEGGTTRAYVNLTHIKPAERTWNWRIAALLLHEDSGYAIDDFIYINDATYDKNEAKPADRKLSEYLSAGCDGPYWVGYSLPSEPKALARSLYEQVVTRKPVGIPSGADMKALAPYLSRKLSHRLALAIECGDDWYRQYPDPNLKPELAWLELGLFSGGDEEDELRTFHIEKIESAKDGSFRIYMKLTWGWPPEKPWTSRVAPVLLREDGRLVVDDMIYLRDESRSESADWRLSESLSNGCDGARWVGFDDKGKTRK